ncbi:MAG: ketol-acid reductoisomerase [Candidatus Melainabacteria bacterium]|nr:ketol-acid reductoisomerase [Candidatus Melainabacteria bacterium]
MPTTANAPQALTMFYDADIDRALLLSKKIAIVGFGSQGYGQSLNLKESGANVRIALRSGSASEAKAKAAGFETLTIEQAVEWADILMFLIPDVQHGPVYQQYVAGKLRPGQALMFSHGFSIHYGEITPPADVDVFLVAPKSPGHLVRSEFQRDRGVPALMAVHQDATGQARQLAMGYAACIGSGRAGVIETTFKDETETDLFGEQAVLCGGASALVKAGFETLVEAGYPPELAYFECLHELKLIVDLMYEGGLADMRYSISDTARYGDVTRGPRVVTEQTKAAMREILAEIQSGRFAREWMAEVHAGMPNLQQQVATDAEHPLETTGRKLRGMMSWLGDGKLVDRGRN